MDINIRPLPPGEQFENKIGNYSLAGNSSLSSTPKNINIYSTTVIHNIFAFFDTYCKDFHRC